MIQSHGFPRCRGRRRAGFTLVELLVVITIIGILISLLLPAVQSARASGRKAQCLNHVKQLGTASLAHQAAHGFFPSGGWGWDWVGDADRGFNKHQPGGWVYNILPYADQVKLHDLPGDGDRDELSEEQKQATNLLTKAALKFMNCPSRRRSIAYPNPWDPGFAARNATRNTSANDVLVRSDYAINSGSQPDNQFYGGPKTFEEADKWEEERDWKGFKVEMTGVSFERSEITDGHIPDGLSNTLLIGEKYLNPDKYTTGNSAADNESMYTGFNNDHYRSTSYAPRRDQPGLGSTKRFGSAHATGCNVVFCDGSARTMPYNVDEETFKNLGNRKDHHPIDPSTL